MSDQLDARDQTQPDPGPAPAGDSANPSGVERRAAPAPRSDGGSSKALTGGGVAVAILLIFAARGAKVLVRKAAEEPEPRPKIVLTAEDQHRMGLMLQGHRRLEVIDAIRQRYHLTADEMNDVLKTVWLAENEDNDDRPPWEPAPPANAGAGAKVAAGPAVGGESNDVTGWAMMVAWDLEAVRKEAARRGNKAGKPLPPSERRE